MDIRNKLAALICWGAVYDKRPTDRIEYPAYVLADYLIDNGVTVLEWVPVTERLPEPFETVCVYDATAKETAAAHLTIHREWVGVCMSHKITHWMQLPQPPIVKEA